MNKRSRKKYKKTSKLGRNLFRQFLHPWLIVDHVKIFPDGRIEAVYAYNPDDERYFGFGDE